MNKKTTFKERIRKRLFLFLIISQALGILGLVFIGGLLDSGFSGYFIGYAIGVVMSLGCTCGISIG
jgi:hypothetical protein